MIRFNLLRSSPAACVFILGMHRSGTSCLAGMLKEYGLYLGDVSTGNEHNLKGNQEGFAVSLDEALLRKNGGSWLSPVPVAAVPWRVQIQIERMRIQMTLDYVRQKMKKWGLKDPRMLFCWPAWEEEGVRFVGTFRHPLSVGKSLEKRSGGDQARDWSDLWHRYNVELIRMYNARPFPIVNFDWEQDRYRRAVENIARSLELAGTGNVFFDEQLRHQKNQENSIEAKCREIYSQLIAIAEIEEEKMSQFQKS